MNHKLNALPFLLLLSLGACDSSDQSTLENAKTEVQSVEVKTLELSWEQLMPKGEDEKLEQLYADFYSDLENQFQTQQQNMERGENNTSENNDSTQDLVSAIIEGSANDTMEQIGTFNVVNELNGRTVRMPGYVVPFDFSAEASYQEFLLVPYFGACLHTPPPPPNQILLVKADQGVTIADINEPVWVEGVLKTGEFNSELADSAYELTLHSIEAYAY